MELEKQAYDFIKQCQLYKAQTNVLVACSGGIDSMVLLDYLVAQKQRLNLTSVAAVHVNHMLRGKESDEDAAFVEAYCEARGIQLFLKAIPIPALVAEEQGNVEAIARRERYRFFEEVMQKEHFATLTLAHHADDQIENVIMALAKGLQQGTQGMPVRRALGNGELVRPFLSSTRQQIENYAAKHQLVYREDSTNNSDEYVRNRLRHHVVPLLRAENPNIAEAVRVFTEQRQQDEAYFQMMAQQVYDEIVILRENNLIDVDVKRFQLQPVALQRRIIQLLLKYLYKDRTIIQSYTLLNRVLDIAKSNVGNELLTLPEGYQIRRNYDKFVIEMAVKTQAEAFSANVQLNEWLTVPNQMRVCVRLISNDLFVENAQTYYANRSDLGQLLQIRTKKDGDRMRPLGMSGTKKVSRIFIDAKIPDTARETWPLLVNEHGDVLAVIGLRMSASFSKTRRATDDVAVMIAPTTYNV